MRHEASGIIPPEQRVEGLRWPQCRCLVEYDAEGYPLYCTHWGADYDAKVGEIKGEMERLTGGSFDPA